MKKDSLKNIEEKILPLSQYPKTEPKSPLILHLKKEGQELFLYGCKHSNNIRNKQFKEIEAKFNYFFRNNHTPVVIIEGQEPPESSKEELIKRYGEAGFLFYLSQNKKLKIYEIEPSWDQLLKFAVKRNRKIDVASWILLNSLHNKLRTGKRIDEKAAINIKSLLGYVNEKLSLTKADNVLELISDNLSHATGKLVLPKLPEQLIDFTFDSKYILKLQSPFLSQTIFNKVGADINLGRDYFLSKNILKLLERGKNVFGVLGLNHVFCTQRVFEEFFKK